MKKITHAGKKKREAAIKRRYNHRLQRNIKHNDVDSVDRISILPDEILASVLSRLRLRDAIATSILSTRWRHLYTKVNSLYIPPITLPQNQEDFSKQVDTINHTLDLFKSNTGLKGFGLNMRHCFKGADLERWFGFVLARKVETIDINMCYDTKSSHYTLHPLWNLIIGTHLPGLKSLKNLFLRGIKVEDPDVELLLSSFPLLESLYILNSDRLKNVSFVGGGDRGLKLKKLWMWDLPNLESIEIRDMINLVSFAYYAADPDGPYSLQLTNVPKLTELRVCENGVNELHKIPSSILDQLQQVDIAALPVLLIIDQPSYELKSLKQLYLKVEMIVGFSNQEFQNLIPLIEACTSLETLELKFVWLVDEEILEIEDVGYPARARLSRNLKRFEMSGYAGNKEETDLALFVMNNAAALEQMIVEPCRENPVKQRKAVARAHKQLRLVAPRSLNLVIKSTLTRSKH